MDEEGLPLANNFKEYIALVLDHKEDSEPECKRTKLDPVLDPEETKLCSPAVRCEANIFSFVFSLFLVDLTL